MTWSLCVPSLIDLWCLVLKISLIIGFDGQNTKWRLDDVMVAGSNRFEHIPDKSARQRYCENLNGIGSVVSEKNDDIECPEIKEN